MALHSGAFGLYFIAFIVITNFSLLNMVVAVITEKILALSMEEKPSGELMAELEAFRFCIGSIFQELDRDASKSLTPEEISIFFDDIRFRRVLEAFEVNCSMPLENIWPIIDTDGSGEVTFEEFLTACQRLRGSRGKANFQVLMLQCDVMKQSQRLKRRHIDLKCQIDKRLARFQGLLDELPSESLPMKPDAAKSDAASKDVDRLAAHAEEPDSLGVFQESEAVPLLSDAVRPSTDPPRCKAGKLAFGPLSL